jgi:hypothetical protein
MFNNICSVSGIINFDKLIILRLGPEISIQSILNYRLRLPYTTLLVRSAVLSTFQL